jgi:hypothetical protein
VVASSTSSTSVTVPGSRSATRRTLRSSSIRLTLVCRRPAVSASTRSAPGRPPLDGVEDDRARVAALGTPHDSAPARSAQVSSCSAAAARKVSPAAITTVRPSAAWRLPSLPMVVVLPTPLTPTNSQMVAQVSVSMPGRDRTEATAPARVDRALPSRSRKLGLRGRSELRLLDDRQRLFDRLDQLGLDGGLVEGVGRRGVGGRGRGRRARGGPFVGRGRLGPGGASGAGRSSSAVVPRRCVGGGSRSPPSRPRRTTKVSTPVSTRPTRMRRSTGSMTTGAYRAAPAPHEAARDRCGAPGWVSDDPGWPRG